MASNKKQTPEEKLFLTAAEKGDEKLIKTYLENNIVPVNYCDDFVCKLNVTSINANIFLEMGMIQCTDY